MLGHLPASTLQLLNKLSVDPHWAPYVLDGFRSCQLGKATKLLLHSAITKQPSRLEFIHSNLLGQFGIVVQHGLNYVNYFVDDVTWFTFGFLLTNKSNMLEAIKYNMAVQIQLCVQVQDFRLVNGEEYIHGMITKFCIGKRMKKKNMVSYSHETKRVAQCLNP